MKTQASAQTTAFCAALLAAVLFAGMDHAYFAIAAMALAVVAIVLLARE